MTNDDIPVPTGSPTGTAPASATANATTSASVPTGDADVHASTNSQGLAIELYAPDSNIVRLGTPLRLDVLIQNSTSDTMNNVGLVVSLGHCGCNPGPMKMFPGGSMQMKVGDDGQTHQAPYVTEAGGTDYLTRTLVPPFTLAPAESVIYHLKLDVDPSPNLVGGTADLDAVRVDPNSHTPVAPGISIPLNIVP